MLSNIFVRLLNMSFTASIVILVVLAVRLLFKKAPKTYSCALWAVVLFRLLCPFSVESAFSLLPVKTAPISQGIITMQQPQIATGIGMVDESVNPILPAAQAQASVNPIQVWLTVGGAVWLLGAGAMTVHGFLTMLKLRKKLQGATPYRTNIFFTDQIDTAFVLGVIRPKIYLPKTLSDSEREYILLHEQTHIKRYDPLWKLLGFLALCLHWFNPLVWTAFFVGGKDMEMSCDEAVIRKLGNEVKKDYAFSLLTLAAGRKIVGGMPLAFGEGDTKSRVKNVLCYKKPTFWVALVGLLAVLAIAVGLAVNPRQGDSLTAAQAAKSLAESICYQNGAVAFTIPEHYNDSKDFNIMVYGTTDTDPSQTKIQLFEKENAAQSWVAGQTYAIDTLQTQYKALFMQIRMYSEASIEIEEDLLDFLKSGRFMQAQKLWEARTQYVGDNAAVGRLIGLLPTPEGLQYRHFELHTITQPYGVSVVYAVSSETLDRYEAGNTQIDRFLEQNALLLLCLIDNANEVKFTLTDENRSVDFTENTKSAQTVVGENVKNYAKSAEKLKELIDFSNGKDVTAPFAITFPAYDQKTSDNASIFEIDPFELQIQLPDSWSVKTKAKSDTQYPLLGAWTPLGIYNEAKKYVGAVGYNTYEQYEGAEDVPQAIYNQIALGNGYHFNAQTNPIEDGRRGYVPVSKTDSGVTAVTEVYLSPEVKDEYMYPNHKSNSQGILSYNKDLLVYIAIELDGEAVTEDELLQIAKSIRIVPGSSAGASAEDEKYRQLALTTIRQYQEETIKTSDRFAPLPEDFVFSKEITMQAFAQNETGYYNTVVLSADGAYEMWISIDDTQFETGSTGADPFVNRVAFQKIA